MIKRLHGEFLSASCYRKVTSVVSDSVRPQRRQPTRLPHPWDSPGKNTGVGCHFLLQCMKVKSESEVTESCLTLCDPRDCRLLRPWDFPGKSTGVGCHSLLHTISQSLLKLMSIESVVPSNCLIFCRPLLLLPSIYPSIRVFSNESALCIRWPSIGVSASASVLPMNIQD